MRRINDDRLTTRLGFFGTWAFRLPAFILTAGIAAAAMWAAGFDQIFWWRHSSASSTTTNNNVPAHVRYPATAAAAQPAPIGTDSSVAKTARPLLLVSTQVGRNAREGTVQLGVSANSPQTYRVGAILANGTRIVGVFADHIEVEREGKHANIYAPGSEPPGYQSPDDSFMSVGGPHPFVAATATSHDALTDVMRVTPVYSGSSMDGLEVYASGHSDAFAQMGLEPGDRITAIDGEPVSDSRKAIASLRRLTGGAAVQVAVNRQGKPMQLSLDGAPLASRVAATQ